MVSETATKNNSPAATSKQPSLPAPVKRMPSSATTSGKRISSDRRKYSYQDDTVTDRQAGTASNDESDKGVEVQSPVKSKRVMKSPCLENRKRKKEKSRRSRSSSNESSRSSSSGSDVSGRSYVSLASQTSRASHISQTASKRTSNSGDKTSKSSDKKRPRKADKDKRSRSPSRDRSVSRHREHSRDRERHFAARETSVGANTRDAMPPPSSLPVNKLYRKILYTKETRDDARDSDSCSATSTRTKKSVRQVVGVRKSRSQQSYDSPEDLLKLLPVEIQNNKLSKKTIDIILKAFSCAGNKPKKEEIRVAVQTVTYVPEYKPPTGESAQENNTLMTIDTGNYLVSALKGDFSYNREAVLTQPDLGRRTLFSAMLPDINETPESLDMVFRQALREMSREMNDYNENEYMTVENAIVICARQLELRLLQKIRDHYKATVKEDILEFFTKYNKNEKSKFVKLVHGNKCEYYVGELINRYKLDPANFDEQISENIGLPSKMRVWTDRETQNKTNLHVLNSIVSVFKDVDTEFSTLPAENRMPQYRVRYKKYIKEVMKRHGGFLSEVVKASELMAWMCFGITTDEACAGSHNMVESYFEVKNMKRFDETPNFICWNYPLSALFPQETPSVTNRTLLSDEQFLDMYAKARRGRNNATSTPRIQGNTSQQPILPSHSCECHQARQSAPIAYGGGAVMETIHQH